MQRERFLQLLAAIVGAVLGVLLDRHVEVQPPCIKPKPDRKDKEPDAPKPPTTNPIESIGRIQFGNAGCTATLIGPARADGQYDVLTAAHCLRAAGQEGTMQVRSGAKFRVRVARRDERSDAAWLVTVDAPPGLPLARLAERSPSSGRVWHAGFGVHNPGNVEFGTFTAGPNSDGQCEYYLSVSPGDSGGAIVLEVSGEVLSPVCCTSRLAAPGRVWGASPEACRAIRP